jgi:hypothetical protein
MKKSIIKFLILTILIVGAYQATKVKPVEVKRVNQAEDNFEKAENFDFSATISIEEGRTGYYDLSLDGYKSGEKSKGSFGLVTEIQGSEERVEGDFIIKNRELYLKFDEENKPLFLDDFFANNYNLSEEQLVENWVKIELEDKFKFSFNFPAENVEVVSEEEEFKEKEIYYYKTSLTAKQLFENQVDVDLFLGKNDLNIYQLDVNEQITLSNGFSFKEPFQSFSTGLSPTLKIKAEFMNFKEKKEIDMPSSALEL